MELPQLTDIPAAQHLPPVRAMARQHRVEQYVDGPAPRRTSRRIARYAAVITGASALLIGGTAAAYVAFKPATVPVADQTRCYTTASLAGGDRDFFGTTVSQAYGPGGTRTAEGAVEVCASLWQQGLLQLGVKQIGQPDPSADHPVPALVACVLANGVAAVFPGDAQTCARLGLPQLDE